MRVEACIGLTLLAVAAGCAGVNRVPPADQCTTSIVTSQGVSTGRSQSAPTLELVEISPVGGATLKRSSVLAADLAYEVRDFQRDAFKVMAQFDTNERGRTTDGTFKEYPVLESAAGKIHFCFPMAHVWSGWGVTRPFAVRFFLNRMLGDGSGRSIVVARTETLTYQAEP